MYLPSQTCCHCHPPPPPENWSYHFSKNAHNPMPCPYFSGFLLKEATPKKLITFMSQRCPLIKKLEHSWYEIACNRSWEGGPCNLPFNQNAVTSNMSACTTS